MSPKLLAVGLCLTLAACGGAPGSNNAPSYHSSEPDVVVGTGNGVPVANAGADVAIPENSVVRLDGSGSSDPEGEALTYLWVQISGPTVTFGDATSAAIEFTTPQLDRDETLVFQLWVGDGINPLQRDNVSVSVDSNSAPTANAGSDQSVREGTQVQLAGVGITTEDGETLTYSWTQVSGVSVTISGANTTSAAFTAPDVDGNQVLEFQLIVNDGTYDSTPDRVAITVIDPGPESTVATANAGDDATVADAITIALDGSGSSATVGSIASYAWTQLGNGAPAVEFETTDSAQVNVVLPDVTEQTLYEFELMITDSDGAWSVDTVAITSRDINCIDSLATIPSQGAYATGTAGDFIPLCDGDVFVANQVNNRVDLVNVISGTVLDSFNLSAAPTDLEYDTETGLLYAAMSGASRFAIIDRNADTVSYVDMPGTVKFLSAGQAGDVYVSVTDSYTGDLYKVNAGGDITGPWAIDGSAIRYNAVTDEVLTATFGLSPSTLTRYAFDGMGGLLEQEQLRPGSNGQDLVLAPDGNSLALACGGGNGDGYTIFDFNAQDLSVVRGEFDTGAYPSGVAYSEDGELVAASNYDQLQVFNRDSHSLRFFREPPDCDYFEFSKVGFSRSAAIVFIKQTCGIDDDDVRIRYYRVE